MIYRLEDLIDELQELHPEVTRDSLIRIVKKGLFGINAVMRKGNELIIRGNSGADWIKFYDYKTPEEQQTMTVMKNLSKKKRDANKTSN